MEQTNALVQVMENSIDLSVRDNMDLVNGMIQELGGVIHVHEHISQANVNMYITALIARKVLEEK